MSHFTYVYDGWKLIDEPRRQGDAALDSLQANPHYDGGDRLTGGKRSQYDPLGTEEAYYVQGPGADEPLTRNPTIGQISYYNQDGNGNVTALTDASGNVIEHYAYDPFGNVTVTSSTGAVQPGGSSIGNRFMFTGREYIAEIGLYDYRNRVYSPGLGTFLQTDPLKFQAGDVNIYRYVGNNTINLQDPSGEGINWRVLLHLLNLLHQNPNNPPSIPGSDPGDPAPDPINAPAKPPYPSSGSGSGSPTPTPSPDPTPTPSPDPTPPPSDPIPPTPAPIVPVTPPVPAPAPLPELPLFEPVLI